MSNFYRALRAVDGRWIVALYSLRTGGRWVPTDAIKVFSHTEADMESARRLARAMNDELDQIPNEELEAAAEIFEEVLA